MSADKPYQDESTLRYLYGKKGLSQPQMAHRLGCSTRCISYWMDKHDILVGKHSEDYSDQRIEL